MLTATDRAHESKMLRVLRASPGPIAPRVLFSQIQGQGEAPLWSELHETLWRLVSTGRVGFTTTWKVQLVQDDSASSRVVIRRHAARKKK